MVQIASQTPQNVIITSDDCQHPVSADWFSAAHWIKQQAVTGESHGRNTTYFFCYDNSEYVLRHYYRGGLIGRFNKDSYLFSQLESTRAYSELKLLEELHQLGLPAPAPLAGLVQKQGLFYKADLIIEKIPNAQDAFHLLKQQALSEAQWNAIGSTIALFHHHNVFHSDLNIHNIMLDNTNKIWLIDFDKGERNKPGNEWKQANLDRLLRSLRKEKGKFTKFQWQEKHWQWLLHGYRAFKA